MLVALSTLLRLFAPYLPFVTEEVWSWWRPGSVHHARWPTADEVVEPIGGADAAAVTVFAQSQAALAEVRRIKALAKKPVKAVIERAVLPAAFEALEPAARDFQAATHIRELSFADVDRSRAHVRGGACRVKPVPFEPLDPGVYRELVRRALAEDFGWGDVTTETVIDRDAEGARRASGEVAPASSPGSTSPPRRSGSSIPASRSPCTTTTAAGASRARIVAEYRGQAAALLTAERTALNFLQRSQRHRHADARSSSTRRPAGSPSSTRARRRRCCARWRSTRCAPAAASIIASGLDDGILIKDNHVRLAGGVEQAVTRMRKANREMPTEVEAQTLDQVDEALRAGADIVLLDNLSTADIIEAVKRCRGRAKTEISGGVTLARMPELAATGADYVSIGALTHSAPAADLSFEIEPA